VLPYDPNKLAQITRSVRTHTVGIILPTLYNPFYHELLQGIEDIARYTQTLLFVCDTHEDEKEAERYFAQLSVKQVDGVIVVSRDVSHFLPGNHLIKETYKPILPFVSVDWPESLGYSVIIDLENAGYQATRHLLEHDHHRIGLITFSQDTANVRPVNAGYFRALSEFGIAEEPELIARVPGFDIDAGMQGAQMLLSHEYPPTAIFTIADTLALGVMQAIHKAGQRIPDDVALTSFNDIVFANLVCPPLTTVAAPVREMGVQAMKMLQDLIAGKKPSKKCILLPTSLVVRQSCGCGQKN
jgi:DNA-binding LacI/PurR family transcriptional regulator